MSTKWSFVWVVLLSPAVAGTLPAQDARPLSDLAFMAGCWRGVTASGSTIEEQFTVPSTNLMLGLTRYLRDGTTRGFEFHMIGKVAEGSHLIPHPGGKASVTFVEARREAGYIAWENPEHDFPQRISYRRMAPDSLAARIELLDGGRAQEFRMGKVGCGVGER